MSAIWPLDIHTVNMLIFGYDTRIYRIDGTMCASYYGAFQSWMYPSSEICIRKNCISTQHTPNSHNFEVMLKSMNLISIGSVMIVERAQFYEKMLQL